MSTLHTWAAQWGVPYAAVADLQKRLGMDGAQGVQDAALVSEAGVQSAIRLEAAKKGVRLYRNNVGVLNDDTGRPVRYGLANDSPAINKVMKSSDLIGIRPVTITPAHIGQTIGQFVAREVKAPGWRYGASEREVAQLRFINLVASLGGDAAFAAGTGTL